MGSTSFVDAVTFGLYDDNHVVVALDFVNLMAENLILKYQIYLTFNYPTAVNLII